ncbi:allantoinase, mitochondrial isoform X2 [Oncorhynchus keta]|uniref:allantoinase, mitochondrial isoform X2 n=1 Tax=Oncorhynchus keta TaxID=8018 RepID=UPI00227D02D9|nr:allantoinase, mitochondrial isoform X2 [Oncorhynchus keta]
MEPGSTVSAVRSSRVLCGTEIRPALIVIKEGKIHKILPDSSGSTGDTAAGCEVLDVGDHLVMPGIVDCHVHVNEPGRTTWEGFWTATRAAAAGGVTTIVDMPLNSIPPTTTLDNFHEKMAVASGKCFVDTAFWGGVIPGNQFHAERDVPLPSEEEERDVPLPSEEEERDVPLPSEEEERDVPLPSEEEERDVPLPTEEADPKEYSTFLKSRPDVMELEAIRTVTELCLKYQVHCHIVHLSSAQPLALIQAAKQAGAPLTVETTHHYLSLSAEHIPAGATQFKCCPPIRGVANQEQLWSALKSGQIDMVVSDHSPCTPDLKRLDSGDFTQAWGGISSLQFGLSLFWTSANKKGFTLPDVVRLLCQRTAQLCRLDNQKGSLVPGHDADLVIWDPEKEFEVKDASIHHKNKLTPYLGLTLLGEVSVTIVRGRVVYKQGSFSPTPLGKHLLLPQGTTQVSLCDGEKTEGTQASR